METLRHRRRGEHDDEVFALALALNACNEPVSYQSRRRGPVEDTYLHRQKLTVDTVQWG